MSKLVRLATWLLLMGSVALSPGQARKDIEVVGYLCGKLVHLDSREKVAHGGTLEHTSPLPNISIKLYARDKTPCCENSKVIREITTGSDGGFTFETTKPAFYWFVSNVGGREYKLALQLTKPDATSTTCRNQQFEIEDSGKLRILRMVGYL